MRNLTRTLVVVFSLLAGVRFGETQTVQGVVTGTVTDPTGAAIPNAQLTLTNQGTQITQNTVASSSGSYRFPLVPPGKYTLTAKAPGFAVKETKDIGVDASQTVPVDVRLDIATSSTAVEVTTQSTIVQTASSTLATTVNQNSIAGMPLLTRNVFDLAFLAPQVQQGMNFGPSSGGARESGTVYLMNGADNNDNFDEGLANVVPPLDSVAEFSILTNQFDAEYGRGSGAIVSAVQKSGTNTFHGSLYEFHRDANISSNDFFSNRGDQPKPKFIRNQFGGEVDGPIKKDKTFFSFAFDRVDIRTGANLQVQVPTAAELGAMTAGAGPLASYYLTKYPLRTSEIPCPNEPSDAFGHIGCFFTFDAIPTTQNTYFARIDQNFSSSDRLSVTANVQRYTNTDAFGQNTGSSSSAAAQPFPTTDLENYHQIALVETHTFSPILVNEFTVGHNRHFSDLFEGSGSFTDPEIYIDGANFGSFGFNIGPNSEDFVEAFTQDRWQIQDNLGWTLGKHSIKIGGGWQYGNLYRNWDLGGPGYYEFANTTGTVLPPLNPDGTIGNPNGTNYGDSNFQHDYPYYQEIAVDPRTGAKANAYRHYIGEDSNAFVNDDWKFSKTLTLNLGLRWEHFGAPREANGILAQFTNLTCLSIQCVANAVTGPVSTMWKTNYKDFAPRVGFAWDVRGDGKTAIRGGYGIFYDRIFDNVWSNAAWNPPFYALVDHDATAGDLIYYSVPAQAGPAYNPAVGPGRVSVRTMDVAMKDQYEQSFHFTVEQQLASSFLIRIGYQGSLGRHLPVLMNLNRYDGDAYNPDLAVHRPNPLYTGFNYRANSVSSNYNSLVTEVQKRFSSGLQFQFSYSWSKLLDYNSALFAGSTTQGSYSQPYYYITNSNAQNEYGPGAFDHTHSFKFNYYYELPFLRTSKSFVGKVLGGWQISGFYQGYSGHPLEIYNGRRRWAGDVLDANGVPENIGGDYNLDGVNNDRPVYIGPSNPYSNGSPADGIFTDNNPIGCGNPGGQSSAAAIAGCNANFGVNTPNSLFVNPGGGPIRYGMGRDVFRGPWYNNFDAAISKNFPITERLKLQFRADAVNVLNHPNFDCINTDLNAGTFGRGLCLAGDGGIYGPSAGGSWANGVARRFQFSARIFF